MKQLLLSAIPIIIISALSSCQEQKKITMEQVNRFQDSIPNIVPGTRSIHTLQKDDLTKVTIIVGSPSFYSADADKKQQVAIKTGLMILHVLGPDNSISNATLVLSQKDSNDDILPADAISLDMKIDSLKKVVYPK